MQVLMIPSLLLAVSVTSHTPAEWADGCHAITSSAATYEQCLGGLPEEENKHLRALSSISHGRQLDWGDCGKTYICKDVCNQAAGGGFGVGMAIGMLSLIHI